MPGVSLARTRLDDGLASFEVYRRVRIGVWQIYVADYIASNKLPFLDI